MLSLFWLWDVYNVWDISCLAVLRRPSGSFTVRTWRTGCWVCGGETRPPWWGSCPTLPSSSAPTNSTRNSWGATSATRESEWRTCLSLPMICIFIYNKSSWLYTTNSKNILVLYTCVAFGSKFFFLTTIKACFLFTLLQTLTALYISEHYLLSHVSWLVLWPALLLLC